MKDKYVFIALKSILFLISIPILYLGIYFFPMVIFSVIQESIPVSWIYLIMVVWFYTFAFLTMYLLFQSFHVLMIIENKDYHNNDLIYIFNSMRAKLLIVLSSFFFALIVFYMIAQEEDSPGILLIALIVFGIIILFYLLVVLLERIVKDFNK